MNDYILLLCALILYGCSPKADLEANAPKDLYQELICKDLNLNDVMNEQDLYDCLHYKSINEPCLNEWVQTSNEKHIRLTIEIHDVGVKIISIKQQGSCWIQMTKVIPPHKFSLISYLLQDNSISYFYEMYPVDSSQYAIYKSSMDALENVPRDKLQADTLYVFEIADRTYSKKFTDVAPPGLTIGSFETSTTDD